MQKIDFHKYSVKIIQQHFRDFNAFKAFCIHVGADIAGFQRNNTYLSHTLKSIVGNKGLDILSFGKKNAII